MLNIILTSYNRPNLIKRTIESLLAQTSDQWRCTILDDNSDNKTLGMIFDYASKNKKFIRAIAHTTTPEQRASTTRYSALINEVLPTLDSGIVSYLCDNVEYHPDLVRDVLYFFDHAPSIFSGYVMHLRDTWKRDGMDATVRLGTASQFGHWDVTPPEMRVFGEDVRGWLDHSQVFHRLPVDIRWNEDVAMKGGGDGDFFNRLIEATGAIYPIETNGPRTLEHLLK